MPNHRGPGPSCRRCEKKLAEHDKDGYCPDGSGRLFQGRVKGIAASASFNEPQLQLLEFMVKGLMSSRDISAAVRHKSFNGLAAIVNKMKATAIDQRRIVEIARREEEENANQGRAGSG